jgi:2-polyprenyl-6-methoxyphenol hydroxylase-like FAD-dependent oxidoreductase
MTKTIIVGAGPAGATLALLLAKRGISVKLIEASRNFRRVFRGEGLMPSGLNAIEQMGLSSILERIPHRPLAGWEVLIENRSLFRVEEPIESGGKPCTLVSQPHLLEAIVEEATTYSNFEFIQGAPVQDLLCNEKRVAGVKLNDDRELFADLVIGADGRNSIIRQKANLTLEQQNQSFNILWFKLPDSQDVACKNDFYSIVKGTNAFGLFRGSEGNLQIGWALHEGFSFDWKQIDWSKMLASVSPPWLAVHLQKNADKIDRPILLSVVVGLCPRWYTSGLLLLGDAVHPMSPVRAQGINMALRDVIVAANYLLPLLSEKVELEAIDRVLPKIQAEREPEIIKMQQLQQEESAQGEKLIRNSLLRWTASSLAPLISKPIKNSWLDRQKILRQGITQVNLEEN